MGLWGHGGLYADWCAHLDRWSASPVRLAETPPALSPEDFDSDTWVRLTMRIQDALAAKLDRWSAALLRGTGQASDEFTFGRALVRAREGLQGILDLGHCPELPEVLREQLRSQIEGTISEAQQQLLDQAQRELRVGPATRNLAELKIRQIRANPLTGAIDRTPHVPHVPDAPPITAAAGGRRKILIDRIGDA